MITVQEAEKIITQNTKISPAVTLPLASSIGHILREDIYTDRNQPPFNRIAMDGIAIRYSAWENGKRTFSVQGIQKAGMPPLFLESNHSCFEVMTGAVLPEGCDCVVRYEDITLEENSAKICSDLNVKVMQNIHREATDYKPDEQILKKGSSILSPHIAILASVGKANILVDQRSKIAVISTGDELVDVKDPITFYQIRQSNGYAIQSNLHFLGYKASRYHVNDHKHELYNCLETCLSDNDLLILTGGVSMGKLDFIPEVLQKLKVEVLFHKVSQRPGKPLWFGKGRSNQVVFALPGNPVSALICFHRYIIPHLSLSSGEKSNQKIYVALTEDVHFNPKLSYFLPVRLWFQEDAVIRAIPVKTRGSGDFGSLSNTDGFIELEADQSFFPKGKIVPFYSWQKLFS